jgi:hypothetical protein
MGHLKNQWNLFNLDYWMNELICDEWMMGFRRIDGFGIDSEHLVNELIYDGLWQFDESMNFRQILCLWMNCVLWWNKQNCECIDLFMIKIKYGRWQGWLGKGYYDVLWVRQWLTRYQCAVEHNLFGFGLLRMWEMLGRTGLFKFQAFANACKMWAV